MRWITAVAVLTTLAVLDFGTPGHASDSQKVSSLAAALRQLGASSEAGRKEAKEALKSGGEQTAQVLLPLLDWIMHDLHIAGDPSLDEAKRHLKEALRHDPDALQAAIALDQNIEIHDRLSRDLIEVLASIGTPKAVPLFAKSLYGLIDESTGGGPVQFTPGMIGLVLAGEKAVPEVLDVFQRAEALAPFSWAGYPYPNGAQAPALRTKAFMIRVRAAMVLGEIGDARALPVLKEFLATDGFGQGLFVAPARYIEDAVKKIERRFSDRNL